jgi:hypothetical protein
MKSKYTHCTMYKNKYWAKHAQQEIALGTCAGTAYSEPQLFSSAVRSLGANNTSGSFSLKAIRAVDHREDPNTFTGFWWSLVMFIRWCVHPKQEVASMRIRPNAPYDNKQLRHCAEELRNLQHRPTTMFKRGRSHRRPARDCNSPEILHQWTANTTAGGVGRRSPWLHIRSNLQYCR